MTLPGSLRKGQIFIEALSCRVFSWSNDRRWGIFAVAATCVLAVHLAAAASLIAFANQDLARSDQGAEIWLAKVTEYHGYKWPLHTDGVRHPLWSWIAQGVSHPDDTRFFQNGKWLNTALVCLFILVLGAMSASAMGGLPSATLMALSSLGILLVRGVFFQPEPIYYGFSFFAALACWKILGGSGGWWYGVLGVGCGLAMLAKPSFEPMAALFVGALIFRMLLQRKICWRNLAGVLAAGGVAFAMMSPLLVQKQALFGSATFSYPKVWMWMDDFYTEA